MPSPSDKVWENKGKQVFISVLRIAIEFKLFDFFKRKSVNMEKGQRNIQSRFRTTTLSYLRVDSIQRTTKLRGPFVAKMWQRAFNCGRLILEETLAQIHILGDVKKNES